LERTTSVVAGESGEVRKSGYARDDKKERVVARKGRLLEERVVAEPRHFPNLLWATLYQLGL
jgi:hypothetical protein